MSQSVGSAEVHWGHLAHVIQDANLQAMEAEHRPQLPWAAKSAW